MLRLHGAEIKPALSCTAEDGEFVGHLLVDAAFASSYVFRPHKRRQASVVSAFVVKTEMLRTCAVPSARHPPSRFLLIRRHACPRQLRRCYRQRRASLASPPLSSVRPDAR